MVAGAVPPLKLARRTARPERVDTLLGGPAQRMGYDARPWPDPTSFRYPFLQSSRGDSPFR
jgi:hypothetical protein